MWQYRYTDELYHYGVKGMKWGVRRELGRKAKTAAYLEGRTNNLKKKLNKAVKVRDKGGDYQQFKNDRVKSIEKQISVSTSLRNKLVSELSEKDISKGRMSSFDTGFWAGLLGGPVGAVLAPPVKEAVDRSRVKKYAREYEMEYPFK